MLEVMIGGLFACLAYFYYILRDCKTIIIQLETKFNESAAKVEENTSVLPSLNGLKEEIFDIVDSAIENLSPPTAIDHIAGAASQWFQMRMMKELGGTQMIEQVSSIAETVQDVVETVENV